MFCLYPDSITQNRNLYYYYIFIQYPLSLESIIFELTVIIFPILANLRYDRRCAS
jgi:hypothetical protein